MQLQDALAQPVILCVDDEPNILSSLRRMFRGCGYEVLTANSGESGLKILRQQQIDLVISDMRMPQMNGAQFLEAVRQDWPETIRLLLTGYADIDSILQAINSGEIHRYITKPWNDNDIQLIVLQALERKRLELEKLRLEALTLQQNMALIALNSSLEEKVRLRTGELCTAQEVLLKFNARLKSNFQISIKMFSSLIEMRGGNPRGLSTRVADLAHQLSVQLGLDEHERDDVFVAAMLHLIGKVTLADNLLHSPETVLTRTQLGAYRKHPISGAQLLMPLDDMRNAADIIRAHREWFNGGGYPKGLAGTAIPLGARILALASDYEALQSGLMLPQQLGPDEARQVILEGRGTRYDPFVVDAFIALLGGASTGKANTQTKVPERPMVTMDSSALRPDMVLARDLISAEGYLLLSVGHVLNPHLIRQVQEFEKREPVPLVFTISQ